MKKLTKVLGPPKVQVAVLVAADTDMHGTDEAYLANVDANMHTVQQFYFDQFYGRTFDFLPAKIVRDTRTEAQVTAAFPPGTTPSSTLYRWWVNTLRKLSGLPPEQQGVVGADPNGDATFGIRQGNRMICCITPSSIQFDLAGVHVGGTECFGPTYLPGHPICGSGPYGRIFGGIGAQPGDPFPVTLNDAIKVVAHEMGHGLLGTSFVGANESGTFESYCAHPGESGMEPDPAGVRIMGSGAYPTGIFNVDEKQRAARSMFLTHHASRP